MNAAGGGESYMTPSHMAMNFFIVIQIRVNWTGRPKCSLIHSQFKRLLGRFRIFLYTFLPRVQSLFLTLLPH
jgi:hypothetical protein